MKYHFSLRQRMIASLIAALVMYGVIIVSSFVQTAAAQEELSFVQDHTLKLETALGEIKSNAAIMVGEPNSFAYLWTEAERNGELDEALEEISGEQDEFFEAHAAFVENIEAYRQLAETDEERALVDQMTAVGTDLYVTALSIFSEYRFGGINVDLDTAFDQLETHEDNLDSLIADAEAAEREHIAERNAQIADSRRDTNIFQASVFAISLLLLGSMGFGLIRGVLRPVGLLEQAAIALRGGNMDHRVNIQRDDELGTLGSAFDEMATSLQRRDNEVRTLNAQLEGQLAETQLAREAAERADQVKSAFLASMSHELRTPLNSVINFTKFVAKGMMGPVTDEQVSTLSEVIDSAKHLLNLINDVLDMSKIESGSLRLFVEDNVSIQAVLDQVVSTGKSLIEDRPVQIATDIPANLPPVRGDRQRLLQILLNIMSNACKFTEQGQITIRAAQHNGSINISIQDSGPGIAPEDQSLVFEAFKQTNTGLRQGGGTGLGMPISKSLTEAHGGRLWLESAAGQGATFVVELPIQAAHLTPIQTGV